MNTEQIKTDKSAIEILREEYKSKLTSKDIYSLHDEIDQFCDDEELEPRNAVLSAMEIFASQESKRAVEKDRESRWISVKDRLPELNESILMFGRRSYSNANRVVCSGLYARDWYSAGEFVFDVTHWQPIPESPKL